MMGHRISKNDPTTTKATLDSLADGVFTVDEDFVIKSFNRAAEQISGIEAQKAVGRKCGEVFNTDMCSSDCPLVQAIKEKKSLIRYPVSISCDGGNRAFTSVTASPMKDRSGKMIGGVVTIRDLSLIEELQPKVQGVVSFEEIISRSDSMREIISILPRIAESESTVLIEGESGTGKDLVARAIHNLSSRKNGPFVTVNCGALPDTLLESELFGYKAGAFTDAKKDKPGRFAQADNGSIFLDEIGDVSTALQVSLLRVIQKRTFEPLGSTQTVRSNVRVIAATNKELSGEVSAGRFRQDLYYRVNVFRISLPPLRERKEDILPVAENFIHRMNIITRKNIQGLSPGSIEVFMNHDWPGNIRELENVIEHAFILCSEGLILCEHLPASLPRQLDAPGKSFRGKTLAQIETQAIIEALERHGGNRAAASKELGVDKSTIWRKMKKLMPD